MKIIQFLKRAVLWRGNVDLGACPVLAGLLNLALPSVAMALFHTCFHLVDTIFVSWLGTEELIAISYTFPVQIGVFAILEGIGNGMTALVGQRLGEKNHTAAEKTAFAGIGLAYLTSVPWILFFFPSVSNGFFALLGADSPRILRQAWLYDLWMPLTMPLASYTYISNSVFRCQGDTVTPLIYFIIANGLNAVLDPVFMFVFGWGITGAGAATFVGRAAGLVYIFSKLRSDSSIPVPLIPRIKFSCCKLWFEITKAGLPVTLTSASIALGMGSVNKILAAAYGQSAIAAWMLAMRVENLAFRTLMGINDAAVPFFAFNYGKRDLKRLKEGMKSAFAICAVITGTFGAAVALFPYPILALFKPAAEVACAAARCIRISVIGYPFVIYTTMYGALFIAAGRSVYGLAVQLFRSMVFRVAFAYLLAAYAGYGQIWWFQTLARAGACAMTFCFAARLARITKAEFAAPSAHGRA